MNHPEPPPDSKYFRQFSWGWEVLLPWINVAQVRMDWTAIDTKWDELKPIIAAVAVFEWNQILREILAGKRDYRMVPEGYTCEMIKDLWEIWGGFVTPPKPKTPPAVEPS